MKTDWMTKGLLVFVGSGLWAMALMHGQPVARAQTSAIPNVIKAHKFELVDANGKPRAALAVSKYGAGLGLNDVTGTTRAILSVGASGSRLDLSDAIGKTRVALGVDDGPGLALYDANEKIRAAISVDEEGPALYLADANGTDRAILGVTQTVNKVTGAATTSSPGTLTLYDKNGNVLYQRP